VGHPLTYLAGPFFNPAQVLLMEQIEQVMDRHGVPTYKPRIDGGVLDKLHGPERMADSADECYQHDLRGLTQCELMLAVLTYELDGHHLALGHTVFRDGAKQFAVDQWGVSIPDTGTVWEVGFFTAECKPVVGFYPQPRGRLNIMLTQSVHGFVFGLDNLDTWVREGMSLDSTILADWEGSME